VAWNEQGLSPVSPARRFLNFWIVELDGSSVRRGGEVVEVREPE